MRIGIDLQSLGDGSRLTGVGKYALNLSKALLNLKSGDEFTFFHIPTSSTPDFVNALASIGGEVVSLPKKRLPFFSFHYEQARFLEKFQLDVFHGPANIVPFFYRGKKSITIHDLAIYLHPEWFPRGQFISTRFSVPESIKHADKIIVPSQSTKQDLIKLFSISQDKIKVIPHGVEKRFFEKTSSSQTPINFQRSGEGPWERSYFLFIGMIEPRKNLNRVLAAYNSLPRALAQTYALVIAGASGWRNSEIFKQISQINQQGRGEVILTDYYPDEELPALLAGATALVYPSLYEGFGLPILEAFASNTPVITSNLSSTKELAQNFDSGVFLVNPYSIQDLTNAFIQVFEQYGSGQRVSENTRQKVKSFSWQRTAEKTLEIYRTI